MRRPRPATLLAALLVVLVLGAAVLAVATPPTVVVGEGETVRGDQVASGETVVVAGTVEGDLRVFAGTVVVAGNVTGDVQAFGGTVRLAGDVGGETVAYGGSVVVTEEATLSGPLNAGGRTVRLAGTIDDDAQVLGSRVVLADSGQVAGNLVYDARLVDEGGEVGGALEPTSRFLGPVGTLLRLVRFAPLFVPALAASLGLAGTRWLVEFDERVTTRLRAEPLDSLAIGLATVLALLLATGLLAGSLVGLPVAAVVLTLGTTLALVGLAVGQLALGGRLLTAVGLADRDGWGSALVGAAVVALAWQVPTVGVAVPVVALLTGLGALVTETRRRQR